MTKKSKVTMALSGLLVVSAIGGSYAYWNQTATIDNPFDTGTYGTSVVENFTPEKGKNWQPGATIDKEVYVTNEGNQDIIARVKLDETWTYAGEDEAYKENGSTGAVYNKTMQDDIADGLTTADGTVVEKTFSASAKWVAGGDGWYYYTENVKPGVDTDQWLTDVTLDKDTDMGVYNTTYYLSTDDGATWSEYVYVGEVPTCVDAQGGVYYESKEGAGYTAVTNNKSVVTVDADAKGYSDSDYVLSITVETVQATEEAVNAMFGVGTTDKTYAEGWNYYADVTK